MLYTAQGSSPDTRFTVSKPARSQAYRAYGKRLFDVTFVLVTLPFLVPVIGVIAALVRLDGSPAFFVQDRIGQGGRVFRCLKIRTMVPDADRHLADHLTRNPGAHDMRDKTQILENDPRVTRIGGFLRKTSLDELPQFLNVLAGDMSIVGPRPFLPDQQAEYERAGGGHSYYALRPGITGLWQVGSRDKALFLDRIRFDTAYADRVSLIGDIKVIVATIGVVLRPTGA